jgi:DDE superfamily endonuclease
VLGTAKRTRANLGELLRMVRCYPLALGKNVCLSRPTLACKSGSGALTAESYDRVLLREPDMPQAVSRDAIYYRRRYSPELIEQCVRWYLTYRLSYRDLTALMAEREVSVSHTTIMRWVRHYVPEYERRWSRFSKPIHSSWRMDETSVSVGGRWNYLYRAVDRSGKSVHSLLREDRT